MGEIAFIGNCSVQYGKEQIGNAIEQFIESYCKFYGIRNRKTNKFIYIGTLDDRILWCDFEKNRTCNINAK